MARILNRRLAHYILLLVVTAVLTLPGLGASSLWDIDEGLNAEAAREMFESGDYVVPTFNFKPRTAKPAMLYWLQALAYQRFGVNEFAARLPSALAGAVAVLLTYSFGRRMFGPAVGLLAGVIVVSTVQVTVLTHAATPDALLLACMTLTLWLFWTGAENGGRRWAWATGLGCGLAVLAKGPVGVVMPAAIGTYFFLAQRQSRRLLDPRLLGGLFSIVAIAGPWYAPSAPRRGAGSCGASGRRRTSAGSWADGGPLRAGVVLPGRGSDRIGHVERRPLAGASRCGAVVFLPLSRLCGRGVGGEGSSNSPLTPNPSPAKPGEGRNETVAVRFLICWAAVYIGFFSLARTKLPNYIVPVYPPLALLTARFLDRWRRGVAPFPRWQALASVAMLALIGVGVAVGLFVAGGVMTPAALRNQSIAGLAAWAWIGAVPVVAAAVAYMCFNRDRRAGFVTALAGAAVGFVGLAVLLPVRAVESAKAPRALVAAAGACRPADEVRVATLGYFQPSLVFYCQREVSSLYLPQQAVDLLRGPLPAYVFCPADVGESLAASGAGRLAARQRDVFRGADVVVVTNEQ